KMAKQEWFFSKNGQQHGPVGSQRLKELASTGTIAPTDLIWREGMAEWQPASKIRDLFSTKSQEKQNSTSATQGTKSVKRPKSAETNDKPSRPQVISEPAKTNKLWIVALAGGGVLLMLFCGCLGLIGLLAPDKNHSANNVDHGKDVTADAGIRRVPQQV